MTMAGTFVLPLRVYYEDTDAVGVVYYANYLKFAERARTEMVRTLGVEQEALRQNHGIVFVVRSCAIDFLRPARLDDLLVVETRVCRVSGARVDLQQEIRRIADPSALTNGELLVNLSVRLASLNRTGRPVRLAGGVLQAFLRGMDSSVPASL